MTDKKFSLFSIAVPIDIGAAWRVRLLTDRGPSGGGPSKRRNGSGHLRRCIWPFLTEVVALALGFGLALLVAGCGNAAQQQAYERAAQKEQQFTVETAPALIAEYKQVIVLQPGSEWAKKAQTRIEAMEARVKAEELHKSVFQEHGID